MKTNRIGLALVVALAACGVLALAAEGPGGYHLIKKVSFDKAPGNVEYFDYVNFDDAGRRVFMCEGTRFVVTDPGGKLLGSIGAGDLKRCHGVAFVPQLNRGFISDGNGAQILEFDLKTLQVVDKIKGEEDADYILYEPTTKHVFVFNGTPHSITVIDPAKAAVIATIPVGGVPEQAVADGMGMIYDNIASTNEVIALDAKSLQIKARWPVAPAGQPTSMAMDRARRRLFVGGRNPAMLVMMNADSGKVIGPGFPIGDRVDTNTYDPKTRIVASATRAGTLHIFHLDSPDRLSVVGVVQTEFGAKTMGLDPKTHELYLTTSDFGPAPAPTAQQPNPQPVATPGTFRLLIYGR